MPPAGGECGEVDVLQFGMDRLEAGFGRGVRDDPEHCPAGISRSESTGQRGRIRGELAPAGTVRRQIRPSSLAQSWAGSPSATTWPPARIAMREQSWRTSSTMCVERITTTFSPIFTEQVVEAVALLGIEARGGFIDDEQLRIAEQRLRHAEALLHAAGEPAHRLLAVLVEVGLLQQCVHLAAPVGCEVMPLSTAR